MNKKICSCGFAQSHPIPHIHDMTERELEIYLAEEKKLTMITRELFLIYDKHKVSDTKCIHVDKITSFISQMEEFLVDLRKDGLDN